MGIAANDPAIQAADLAKSYGRLEAVRGVSFEVRTGEVAGFLGPNGAGKTTTVRMLSCFLPPTAGSAHIHGLDVRERPREVKSLMGVCPQEDNLDPDFDVLKNLLVYSRYFGLTGRAVRQRALELLDFVALTDKTHAPIASLSGGMKRRLVLARALLNEPRVLILDEPTTASIRRRGTRFDPGGGLPRRARPCFDPLHGGGGPALRPGRDHGRRPHSSRAAAGPRGS
jgi:lipooligosaccharide transport system ATP-binding protein